MVYTVIHTTQLNMVMTWGWLIMEFTACIINYIVYGHPRLGILTMAFKKSSWIPVNGLMIPQNGCITHELTMAHIALACLSCIEQVDPLATKKNDRIMARCSENCLLLHVSDHIFHLADLCRDIGGNWHQATSVPCNPQMHKLYWIVYQIYGGLQKWWYHPSHKRPVL